MSEKKQYRRKWKHTFKTECKECGYKGNTSTTKTFAGVIGSVVKYVCPKCKSKNIKYTDKMNM